MYLWAGSFPFMAEKGTRILTAVPTGDGVSNGSKWYVKYDRMLREIKFILAGMGGVERSKNGKEYPF